MSKKSASEKEESTFKHTFKHLCLRCALFEDLGCAIELHEEIANEDTELHSLDTRNYLFNGQKEGDYLFGQGIINKASIDDKEYLQLYESWCFFAKTRDNVTEEVWEIARKATIIPFSIFTSMFHQCFLEHRFLESTLELLQQFTFKLNLLHLIIRYFLGINPSFLSSVFVVEKNNSYRIDWESFIHGTHGHFSSSENIVINPF
jgi:hypothetical protein